MATLQAKKIAESLANATGVGQVENDATIAGCRVVLQSLRPDQYEQVHAETAEKEDLNYLNSYRMEHLARSVIEVGTQSFRGVDFVEVEVQDPNNAEGKLKTVSLEVHQFIRDYILSTWSREAIDVAFRKFNDVVAKSEKVSAEAVTFEVPDETSEEKYRRLLTEVRELEGELPMDLALRLLEDQGYTKKITTQDFDAAEERLRNMQTTQEAKLAEPSKVEAVSEVSAPSRAPSVAPVTNPQVAVPVSRPVSTADLMRTRQPVHAQSLSPVAKQGQKMSILEDDFLRETEVQPTFEENVPLQDFQESGTPEVKPQRGLDPAGLRSIIDQPPPVRMNPRFRPPPR